LQWPAHCGEHVTPELGLMSSPFTFSLFHYELFALFFSLVKWMWIPDFLQGKTLATFVKIKKRKR
jgi:hypothetical protein